MDHNAFRDFINRHSWTFAKTYAAFCPHEYIVMRKQPAEDWPLFPEIARFIREKGFVAEYGRLGPNWYYIVDEYYYWTLDKNVEDTDLINRAKLSDFEFVDVDGRKVVRRRKDEITHAEAEVLYDAMWNLETKGKTDIRCPRCGYELGISVFGNSAKVFCRNDGCISATRWGL